MRNLRKFENLTDSGLFRKKCWNISGEFSSKFVNFRQRFGKSYSFPRFSDFIEASRVNIEFFEISSKMHWILTGFWPSSDVKSSNGSIPRRSNLTQLSLADPLMRRPAPSCAMVRTPPACPVSVARACTRDGRGGMSQQLNFANVSQDVYKVCIFQSRTIIIWQTFEGSFSAILKPSIRSVCSIFQNLQDLHTSAPPLIQVDRAGWTRQKLNEFGHDNCL